jgi:ACS family sodium-dependent inorganic phosphate cotransporter
VMGVGEGVAMPAMNNMLSRWVPAVERSRSLALVYSGMFVGSASGLLLSPHLIEQFEWPSVFWSFGSLGVVWCAFWVVNAGSSPRDDKRITEAERRYVLANTVSAAPVDAIPWRLILSRREVWAIIACHVRSRPPPPLSRLDLQVC